MASLLFANNATTNLAGPITATATSLNVAAGTGVLFPVPGSGAYFKLTLQDAATETLTEIMHVTAKSGDTFTILRAQEGTTALNWLAGDLAGNLLTAGSLAGFAQTSNLPSQFYTGSDVTAATNAVVVSNFTPANTAPVAGQNFLVVKGSASNTGAVTLQIGSSGAQISVTYKDGSALAANDWPANAEALLYYTGGVYQFVACAGPKAPDSAFWHFGTAGGTATALTTTLAPAPALGAANYYIGLKMPSGLTSGASATLAWRDASGATVTAPLVLNTTGAAVSGGELPGGNGFEGGIFYDGASARVLNSALAPSGGANSITTTQIAPESVTAVRNLTIPGQIAGVNSAETVMTFNFTIPQTGNALITYSALCNFNSGPQGMIIIVYLDGNVLIPQLGGTAASFFTSNCVTQAALGLTAGAHTITATFQSPTSVNIYDQSCTVFVGAR